jgi:hypothetical protein
VSDSTTVYGFHVEESLGTVYDFTAAGTKQGLDLKQIQEFIAVELALESGELALPWSQEVVESNVSNYGPTIEDVQQLLATHPEFLPVACGWAYGKSYSMFYMLSSYRTDGL